jgi:hypothetical protein
MVKSLAQRDPIFPFPWMGSRRFKKPNLMRKHFILNLLDSARLLAAGDFTQVPRPRGWRVKSRCYATILMRHRQASWLH